MSETGNSEQQIEARSTPKNIIILLTFIPTRAVGQPQFCKDRILGQTLQLTSSMQEKTELSVMLKRTTWTILTLWTLEKGITMDKEQTSDKNVILTNLNDSVVTASDLAKCCCCLCIAVNNDLALLVYKWSVMAHRPLLRDHGKWGLCEMNHGWHQKSSTESQNSS